MLLVIGKLFSGLPPTLSRSKDLQYRLIVLFCPQTLQAAAMWTTAVSTKVLATLIVGSHAQFDLLFAVNGYVFLPFMELDEQDQL
jgi:hypothetical protein